MFAVRGERTILCIVPPAPLLYVCQEYYSFILNTYYFIESYSQMTECPALYLVV